MNFDVSSTMYQEAILDVTLFIETHLSSDSYAMLHHVKERKTGEDLSYFELYDRYYNVIGKLTTYWDSDGAMVLFGGYKGSNVCAYYSDSMGVADKIVWSTFGFTYVRNFTDNNFITKRFETYEWR